MAVFTVTPAAGLDQDRSIMVVTWVLTTADPTGDAYQIPEWIDKTWSATGTFGGATVEVQGSNTLPDADFIVMSNAAGGAILTFTALGCKTMIEGPRYVRPKLTTVGAGASITVTLCARRANPMRT